jgi:pyrroline-5-carboxylate reductase
MAKLQIIGGGKMGEALLGGLVDRGWAAADIAVVETVADRRDDLAVRWPALVVEAEPLPAVDAIVAVKPDAVVTVASALGAVGVRRLLSIAAGVTIARIEAAAGDEVAVVRAMPNTPAIVTPSHRADSPTLRSWRGPGGCSSRSAPWSRWTRPISTR